MNPAKRLVGLIGAGIQRSLTPAMHEAEAAAQVDDRHDDTAQVHDPEQVRR